MMPCGFRYPNDAFDRASTRTRYLSNLQIILTPTNWINEFFHLLSFAPFSLEYLGINPVSFELFNGFLAAVDQIPPQYQIEILCLPEIRADQKGANQFDVSNDVGCKNQTRDDAAATQEKVL